MAENISASDTVLTQILAKLDALQITQQTIQAKVRLPPIRSHWGDEHSELILYALFDLVGWYNRSKQPTPSFSPYLYPDIVRTHLAASIQT